MTRIQHVLYLVCLLLATGGSCLAIVGREDVDDAHYEALAAQTPFAGLSRVVVGLGCCGTTGSGVLLDDNWLLTAAHVVSQKDAAILSVEWGGMARGVSAVHFTDEWLSNPETALDQGGDLALLRLAEPFTFGRTTALATGNLDDRFAVMLGVGKGGNGLIGAFDVSKSRAASNTIDRQLVTPGGGGLLVTDFDHGSSPQNTLNAATVSQRYYDDGFVDPLASDLLLGGGDVTSMAGNPGDVTLRTQFPELADLWYEGTTASGDSGGGLFVFDDGTQQWQLAGLTSWGFNPLLPDGFSRYDSRYGDVGLFTDLTRHADWIAVTVPEPGVTILWGVGLLLCGLRRRKRASGGEVENR